VKIVRLNALLGRSGEYLPLLMNKDRDFCVKISVFIAVAILVFFQPHAAEAQEPEKQRFQANVAPVPLTLQAGATFQESSLPPQNTGKGWYRIPSWFAGYWHRREMVERNFGYPDRRQISLRDMRRGYQIDHRGDIWHPRNEPFVVRVDHRDTYDLNDTAEMKPLMVSPGSVVLEISAMGIRVDKATGVIISTTQKREIHTFKPGRNHTIEAESTGMGYDQHGRPLLAKPFQKFYTEYLKAPFKPINNEDGRDYRSDFNDYLESTNQGDLLPR